MCKVFACDFVSIWEICQKGPGGIQRNEDLKNKRIIKIHNGVSNWCLQKRKKGGRKLLVDH
jgi:hypothetical protein